MSIRPSFVSARIPVGLALALWACGDTPPPVHLDSGIPVDAAPTPDGGTPPVLDRERPRILEISPDDGSIDVLRSAPVVITFSEPIAALGSWRASAEGVALDTVTSVLDGAALTLSASGGWPAYSEIEIRLDADWEDEAGNALAAPFVARFWTADDVAPAVISSTPAEGASDVETRLGAIRIRFTEPMDQAAGTVRLEGGPGILDAVPSWSATDVTFAVSGLAHSTDYRIVLEGFRGLDGNALDGAPVLGDGVIDFATGADGERPRAIASTPVEGQVDVEVVELGGVIEVVFDEPMRTSIVSAPITSGGVTTSVSITWVDPTTARFAVSGAVRLDATTALDLLALTDAAGNLLDPAPYLVDGRLDFTTGSDAFVPYVVASTPLEGAVSVPNPLRDVRLGFSEAMDEAITQVSITDGAGVTVLVDGSWSAGATTLVIAGSVLDPGGTYAIDVRGLRDRSGTAVSDAHPYLGDGRLQFSIAAPTGASCDEPLTIAQGTEISPGVRQLLITAAQRTSYNGSASCDPDGLPGGDAVIRVRKTTPALGTEGGRALRIRTYSVSNRANIEVFRGVCDPRAVGAPAAMVRCANHHDDWDLVLDVPAGDYFVWVSTATASGSATDIRVSIEEVGELQEGQSCDRPYDSTSAIYTAPATAADPHRWAIPGHAEASIDIADSNGPFEAISCEALVQDDVVVAFDKASADTVLDITIQPSSSFVVAEIVTGACRPDAPGAVRGLCLSGSIPTSGRRITARAPAGPVHLWLAGTRSGDGVPGSAVAIREIPAPTAPGSSCATAIPIVPGASVPIAPTLAQRYDAPTCFGVTSDVTWYAFESTERLTHVRSDVEGAIGLVNGTAGTQSSCTANATTLPAYSFAPIGSRVCIAVASGSGIASLAIEQIPYTGVGATPAVDLPITRPSLEETLQSSIAGDSWLALTPTRFYQNAGTYGVIEAGRAATTSIIRLDLDNRVLGDSARSVGEALFSITATSTSGPRVFRLADATGRWSPEIWDRGTITGTYRAGNYRALGTDGASLFTVFPFSSSTASPREFEVYRLSTTTPGLPEMIGKITTIYGADAIAADATNLYLNGRTTGTSNSGLYRVERAALDPAGASAPATLIATVASPGEMALDRLIAPRYLYVRGSAGTIHVIADPAGATPRYLGIVFQGESGDSALDVDRATGQLYTFSTRWDAAGAWYRLDP